MSEWGIEEILRAEADAIHGRSPRSDQTGRTFNLALNGLNSAALCLSGGGIRSAAFALGVLQAFATHPRPDPSGPASIDSAEKSLLAKFHYLSTVSGGGYIGSWLSAWRMSKPFAEIWAYLVSRPQGAGTEPAPIRWLRSFSNYLTPKIGLTSADTWAAAALWVRNLILNWFVILPPIFAVVLLIKLIGVASTWVIRLNLHDVTTLYVKVSLEIGAGIIGAIALVIGLVHTMRGRPGSKPNPTDGPDQFHFLWGTLFWSLLSAFLLVHFLASDFVGRSLLVCDGAPLKFDYMPPICNKLAQSSGWNIAPNGLDIYMAAGTLPGATLYTLAWLIAGRRRPGWLDLVAWAVSGAVYSALVAAGLYIYLITPDTGFLSLQVFFLHLVFGVPWVLLSQVFADMIFVGLSSYEPDADADREWFGRSAGWFVAIALAWLVLTFLVFFGTIVSRIIDKDAMAKLQNYAPVVAGISGVATAIFGKSSGVPVKGKTKGLWSYLASMILPVTAAVFVCALLIMSSSLLDYAMFREHLMPDQLGQLDWSLRFYWLFGGLAAALCVLAIASWTVNINRFSLHAIYRNRLTRAFLGASRDRTPDPFTDFDPKDNPEMQRLWQPVELKNWRPFHVINIALNIVSSERRLSWQERKAAPFTVSPLHSGSSVVGYRKSAEYGGPTGITLGTAMAISGAAASPNMGYHSSPAITLLMTMFNVRLGWWLGNPGPCGERSYQKLGPAFAIKPLIQEAFGLTTDDNEYVYLSDGGHFENLGLYEMVRRRCRCIVVSDAGCDESYRFEDLGNAVRKIAIDLGVQIRFYGIEKLRRRPEDGSDIGADHPYYAIGEIDYHSADGGGKNGLILYIKAGYHGCEGPGIRAYANANLDFPHQATIDQWFTESQFESYRALGFEITDNILNSALSDVDCAVDPSLDNVFATLHRGSPAMPALRRE